MGNLANWSIFFKNSNLKTVNGGEF